MGPVVPFLTDSELEPILEAAANAGAKTAGYHLIRLPWEVKDIFKAWLEEHFPLKAAHIMTSATSGLSTSWCSPATRSSSLPAK